ncbi:MAG: NAD(P)H-dependent oxidoreductase [Patescibacteria group bacterium]
MIEIIIGTSRPGAYSRKVGMMIFEMYKMAGIEVGLIDLKDIPLEAFSGDSINARPLPIQSFADRILKADGVHFVTPEYNGGVPGVLKFFIDLLPFPEAFQNRCFAITSVSAGMWSGIRASGHLEDIITYKEGYIFNQKVMLGSIVNLFDEKDNFTGEKEKVRLEKQIKGFGEFVKKIRSI